MTLTSIIFAGILTYFTRMTMIALISRDMLGDKIKAVLEYVPSAVFPAIIFPGIFINDFGTFIEMNDPKIFGALVAVIVGYFSKNIIATISAGLVSYWFFIFLLTLISINCGFAKFRFDISSTYSSTFLTCNLGLNFFSLPIVLDTLPL
jgi:branched-subunit amino acid transport protein